MDVRGKTVAIMSLVLPTYVADIHTARHFFHSLRHSS